MSDAIKPVAWIYKGSLQFLSACTLNGRMTTELRKTPANEDMPLYDQATLDAAIAAERERCAKLCDEIEGLDTNPVFRAAASMCKNSMLLKPVDNLQQQ